MLVARAKKGGGTRNSKADLPVHDFLALQRPGWHGQPGEPQVVVQCIELGCAELEIEEGVDITAW